MHSEWRRFPYQEVTATGWQKAYGGDTAKNYIHRRYINDGYMYSQSNPIHLRHQFPGKDLGSPWLLVSKRADRIMGYANDPLFTGSWFNYTGNPNITFWSPPQVASVGVLDATGASAIARSEPLRSKVDLGVAFAELIKDGVRLPLEFMKFLSDSFRKGIKGAADDYLNIVFGLKPLLSDLRDFWQVTQDTHRLLQQHARDVGRPVRRRWSFEPVTEVQTVDGPCFLGTGHASLLSRVYLHQSRTTTKWFSGQFVYGLPVEQTRLSEIERLRDQADYLYGLMPDLELIWNLLPWSWALDWFTNVGDVVHNINAFKSQGLVMQYGYVMYQQALDQNYTIVPGSGVTGGRPARHHAIVHVKQRRKANPYGFGVDDLSLNGAQLGILAALGLSRGLRDRGLDRSTSTPTPPW